ncbi:MAG: stage II sporulation protein M [Kiritimatiellaeota bacterium]|nr:stage II sporulation protein M [Kiritimatiellota bacterium]
MILDVDKFISREKRVWSELERMLDDIARGSIERLSLDRIKRLSYLQSKVSEDLVRISTFSGEVELRRYLENLVARAYSLTHSRSRGVFPSVRPGELAKAALHWFSVTFPIVFRRNAASFAVSALVTVFGVVFGGVAVMVDGDAKEAIFPSGRFSHLRQSPEDRVNREEHSKRDRLKGAHSLFASQLMVNNISVSIKAMCLGITWGVGTILILFYNGVILGGVAFDYILSGQTAFLFGWLLPHGSIEIPAILIAGQTGLILGNCILRPRGKTRRERLKAKSGDIATLIGGVAVMLVWAGLVESFFSQYHEPVLPYAVKIVFGTIELTALVVFLKYAGTSRSRESSKRFIRTPQAHKPME